MKYILLFSAAILLSNCTSYSVIRFDSASLSDNLLVDGKEVGIVEDKDAMIALTGARNGSTLFLTMAITNLSTDRINFFVRDVSIEMIDHEYQYTRPCRVFTAHEYLSKVKSEQEWAMFFLALGQGLSSYNAGQSTSTTSGSYTTSTGQSGTYTSTTTTTDPSAAAETQERNMRALSSLQEQNAAQNRSLEAALLKDNTIFPLNTISGQIAADVGHGKDYKLRIKLGTAIYNIDFKLLPP